MGISGMASTAQTLSPSARPCATTNARCASLSPRLAELITSTEAAIVEAINDGRPVFVCFSGGRDSAVLAHLCGAYHGRFRLLWVNTGVQFPDVEAFVRDIGRVHELVEIRSDLRSQWARYGLPVELLPIHNALPGRVHREPKLQLWTSCCEMNRSRPSFDFLMAQPRGAVVLHGQRLDDGAPGLGMQSWPFSPAVKLVAPLADWKAADVREYVAREAVPLPSHYAEVEDSLDCWPCTAAPLHRAGDSRMAYLRRNHPDFHRAVVAGLRRVHSAAEGSLRQLASYLEPEGQRQSEFNIVRQRSAEIGDCVIAALATVLRWSYEDTALLLGWPVDAATGLPSLPARRGVNFTELSAPLLSAGFASTVLLARERHASQPGATMNLPSAGEIKSMLSGRIAIVGVEIIGAKGEIEPHALAWTGHELIDCRSNPPRRLDLYTADIHDAVLITPVGDARSR